MFYGSFSAHLGLNRPSDYHSNLDWNRTQSQKSATKHVSSSGFRSLTYLLSGRVNYSTFITETSITPDLADGEGREAILERLKPLIKIPMEATELAKHNDPVLLPVISIALLFKAKYVLWHENYHWSAVALHLYVVKRGRTGTNYSFKSQKNTFNDIIGAIYSEPVQRLSFTGLYSIYCY